MHGPEREWKPRGQEFLGCDALFTFFFSFDVDGVGLFGLGVRHAKRGKNRAKAHAMKVEDWHTCRGDGWARTPLWPCARARYTARACSSADYFFPSPFFIVYLLFLLHGDTA